MSEEGKKEFYSKPITRREFLKKAVKASVVLGGAYLGIAGCTPDPLEQLANEDRLLSEEELQEAHIRIIQAPEVTLKLKTGIFNFPVFKDAAKGKLREVVIVLVDHPNLSWNAGNKLPEEAKLVFRASRLNPRDIPAENWQPSLNTLTLEDRQKTVEKYAEDGDRAIGQIQYIEPGFINVGISKEFYKDSPEIIKKHDRYIKLKFDHPEMENRIYIFVSVGGKRKPRPDQSYPTPEQFKEVPGVKPPSFWGDPYRYIGPGTAGQTLRHEVSHYVYDSIKTSEYNTDTRMLDSIVEAAKKKQERDESGYPFIFVTAEGETITKNKQAFNKSTQQV